MVVRVVFLFLSGWLGWFSNTEEDKFQQQLDQCVELIGVDSLDQAKQIIDIVSIDAATEYQKAKYYQLKGYLHHMDNQLLDALKSYNYSLDHLSLSDIINGKMELELHKNKAHILKFYKNFDESIRATLKAQKLLKFIDNEQRRQHQEAGLFFNLGVIKYNQEKYDDAILDFMQSSQILEHPRNQNYLGLCYLGKEEYDKAITYFEDIIATSTSERTVAKAWHNLALCMDRSGREGAAEYFLKALALKKGKDRVRTLREYGKFAINSKNDFQQAIALLHEAEDLLKELPHDPEYNEVHHWLNIAYTHSDNKLNTLRYADSFFAINNVFLAEQKELREKELQFQLMMAQREYEMEKRLANTIAWYDQKVTYQVLISLMLFGFIVYRLVSWYYTKKSLERELQGLF